MEYMNGNYDRGGCVGALLGLTIGLLLLSVCGWIKSCRQCKNTIEKIDTITVVKHDTITKEYPIAKDSVIVRWKTIRVPIEVMPDDTTDAFVHDSTLATIEIPITQKHYEDSMYEAWVSGYEPNLDSIRVFNTTIERTITITERNKSRRFGVGVQVGAGYGVINRKPDVYIGVGCSYRIW